MLPADQSSAISTVYIRSTGCIEGRLPTDSLQQPCKNQVCVWSELGGCDAWDWRPRDENLREQNVANVLFVKTADESKTSFDGLGDIGK